MPAPFVISMKLVGDASSGVAAVKQQQASLEALEATAFNVQMNTANIAAQFQDIGVTAAMGMNPLMIALQQGTQLSAAIGSGRGLLGTVSALSSAFASIINPVSLATIAVVGLGAAGVQALMGMMNSTEDATVSLEEHAEWLDEILAGYEHAQDAVGAYVDQASRLPAALARLEISGQLDKDVAALNALQEGIANFRIRADAFIPIGSINEDLAVLREIKSDFDAGAISAEDFATKLRLISMNPNVDGEVRTLAENLYESTRQAADLEVKVNAGRKALSALADEASRLANTQILIDVEVSTDSAAAAIKRLIGSTPDLRDEYEKALDDLSIGLSAPDAILRSAAQSAFDAKIAALDEQERRAAVLRSSKDGDKSGDRWGAATRDQEQRLEQMRLEIQLLGASTFEAERQRTAHELLNKARDAGIPITDQVLDQIGQLSGEYAAAQAELEAVTEAQRRANEELDFYRGTFNSFVLDLKGGLTDGMSMWDAFANAGANALDRIADRALGMAADGIFDLIFGSIMGGIGGGLGGGIGFSRPGNFSIGGMASYAAGTSFHPGGPARVHGEEIIELPRGTRVHSAQSAAGTQPAGQNVVFQLIDQRRSGTVDREERTGPNGEKILRAIVRDEVRQASRRGAMGF